MENKGRNIKELKDEGWITDLVFFVAVNGHFNNLNKELQDKDNLIVDMYDKINALKVKLRLWETY
jgi:hypothetical protein